MTKLVAALLVTTFVGVIGFYLGAGLARLGVDTAWAVAIAFAALAGGVIAREWAQFDRSDNQDGADE